MEFELLDKVITIAFSAGAVYGAIRSDLKMALSKAESAKNEADIAHKRIDEILMRRS
jgi:hypothetical protein